MELKDQVVSLELAKKMKELGFAQESLFYWSFYDDGNDRKEPGIAYIDNCNLSFMEDLVSAYTVAELGEMLPEKVCWRGYTNYNGKWSFEFGDFKAEGKTEADARAKMLIYLKENKLI